MLDTGHEIVNGVPRLVKDRCWKGDNRRSTMNMIGSYFGARCDEEGSQQGPSAMERKPSLLLEDFAIQERNNMGVSSDEGDGITEEERRRMHEEMRNPTPQSSQQDMSMPSDDDSCNNSSLLGRLSSSSFKRLTSKISAMLAEEEIHPEDASDEYQRHTETPQQGPVQQVAEENNDSTEVLIIAETGSLHKPSRRRHSLTFSSHEGSVNVHRPSSSRRRHSLTFLPNETSALSPYRRRPSLTSSAA